MSTPSLVHAAVEARRAGSDVTVTEDPGRLRVSGVLPRAALIAWQAVADVGMAWLDLVVVDASQDHVQAREAREDERIRISASFASPDGALHLFAPEGWRSALLDDGWVSQIGAVRLAFLGGPFATRAFPVGFWAARPEGAEVPAATGEGTPRRQVRSHSPDLMAPTRVEPWLASSRPDAPDAAWSSWVAASCGALARCLPSELFRDGGVDRVALAGRSTRRVDLGQADVTGATFEALQAAVAWVCVEGTDIEVRHTFLASELAREWPVTVPFASGLAARLPPALESARLLYKAHLRAGSKGTIKALADLRKTLADEVGKVMVQAKDLAGGVWRDVAVAIGVLAVRFGLEAAKADAAAPSFSAVFALVGVYVAASYSVGVSLNRRFLRSAEASRSTWRSKLYGFLDDDDYRTLAETPVREAVDAYRAVERQTTVAVILLIVGLAAASAVEAGWLPFPSQAALEAFARDAWARAAGLRAALPGS